MPPPEHPASASSDPVDADLVERLASALRAGEAVVVPTDTVYGVAALPAVGGATARLYALKDRRPDVPLAVLVGAPADLDALTPSVTPEVRRLVDRWWPGPLTLVVRRRPELAGWDLGGDPSTIGVRCPDAPLVRAVAAKVGPIATTSANRHGEPTPPTAPEAEASLVGPVAVVADAGPCAGRASTVLDVTGPEWAVLRQGALTLGQVRGGPS